MKIQYLYNRDNGIYSLRNQHDTKINVHIVEENRFIFAFVFP